MGVDAVIALVAGLFLGLLGLMVGILLASLKKQREIGTMDRDRIQAQTQLATVQAQLEEIKSASQLKEQQLDQKAERLQTELTQSQQEKAALKAEYDTLKTQLENVQAQWKQQFEAFLLTQSDVLKTHLEEKASKEYKDKQGLFDQKIGELLKPLYESIHTYKKEVVDIHTTHLTHTAALKEQVERLSSQSQNLAQALSHNKGRGDWGELELIRLLEDSGLQEHVDYVKQTVVGSDLKRPDIRINLPDGRYVFVDAKALQVDLSDIQTGPEETQDVIIERQKRLAKSLEAAIKNLASKEYQAELQGAANIVVLFVPRESMLVHALSASPQLFEMAYKQNVILSGPFNLIGLLKLIHHGWQLARLSKSADDILKLGTDLYGQAELFTRRFEKVGKDIGVLVKDYGDAMTALDGDRTGLLKRVRALEDYGAKGKTGKSLPAELSLPEELRQAQQLAIQETTIESTKDSELLVTPSY